METSHDLTTFVHEQRLADTWSELQSLAQKGIALEGDTYRLAFTDPEFLLRRETRGIRFQLEMLKPDLVQQAMGIEHTIVVFGGARFLSPQEAQTAYEKVQESGDSVQIQKAQTQLRTSVYYMQAQQFARLVAQYSREQQENSKKLYICTGGGPGIMEAANRGAFEVGEATIGLNITLPHEQHANPYVTPELNFLFHYFALRKMHFMIRAKALVAFPGGFGTLDELFEVVTLVQTQKAKPVPIILFGSQYWKKLLNLEFLVEEGAISAQDLHLVHYSDTPEDAWQYIHQFYKLGGKS